MSLGDPPRPPLVEPPPATQSPGRVETHRTHPADLTGAVLRTHRLRLDPLSIDDADEMVAVLADRTLYRYTGNETPPTVDELRRRYEIQTRGPRPPSTDLWLNWIIRLDGAAVGYVQATVIPAEGSADIAWVIGTAHQGRGIATEAAHAMVEALFAVGIDTLRAFIHPRNHASQKVAAKLGLTKLDGHPFDGEDTWARTTTS